MKKFTLIPVAVLMAGLTIGGLYGWSTAGAQPLAQDKPATVNSDKYQSVQSVPGVLHTQYSTRSKLRKAVKALRSAKDDDAKTKAGKELTTLLETVFDGDLKKREKEIANIEARVKELKSILDKRRSARDRIIQLQMKVLLNEAEGLGFPIRGGQYKSRYDYTSQFFPRRSSGNRAR